ncbi:hypothetical protein FHG87_000884 [Trinorchestia longiramus]|nr:hypothetical protein FHG87_000884 [Trinorchestia longiramus]
MTSYNQTRTQRFCLITGRSSSHLLLHPQVSIEVITHEGEECSDVMSKASFHTHVHGRTIEARRAGAATATSLLVSQASGGTTASSGGGCCEGGRTIMTDPGSGQPICSCQYDRLALGSYSRLGSGLGASGAVYGSTYPSSEQSPYPSIGVDSSAFYSPLSSAYSVKDGATGDMTMYGSGLGASPAGYYPYDPTFAAYGKLGAGGRPIDHVTTEALEDLARGLRDVSCHWLLAHETSTE